MKVIAFRRTIIATVATLASWCAALQLAHAENVVEQITVSQVNPLYNWHWKFPKAVGVKNSGVINPVHLDVPRSAGERVLRKNEPLKVLGARGEMVYAGFLLGGVVSDGPVSLEFTDFENGSHAMRPTVNIKLVSSWFQAGVGTPISKRASVATYELLLDSDQGVRFDDEWIRADDGNGWVYNPPKIERLQGAKTQFAGTSKKRFLALIQIPESAKAGVYRSYIRVRTAHNGSVSLDQIPIDLRVLPIDLAPIDPFQYKLFLFTGMVLDPSPAPERSYLNAQRLHGHPAGKLRLYEAYIKDIVAHGFNGITIKDWRSPYLDEVLSVARKSGIQYVVLHALVPLKKAIDPYESPVITSSTVALLEKYGFKPIYYGYDEVGGNKQLTAQLALNKAAHKVGGTMLNAVYWDDRVEILRRTAADASLKFDILAYSMGSHGFKKFFAQLPMDDGAQNGVTKGFEELAYWHPNVENPARNRLFMGFWLWASGLSGVIPHGHYFPAHIMKVVDRVDLSVGRTHKTSPYDDWSYWLPPGNLRHHATVYPAQDGPIPTLQWEGIREGVTDLKYAVMLEGLAKSSTASANVRQSARALLDDIREGMSGIRTSYIGDESAAQIGGKLAKWRAEIQRLLVMGGGAN